MNVPPYPKHTGQEGESVPSQLLPGHMLVAFVAGARKFDQFFKVREMSSSKEQKSTDGVDEALNQLKTASRVCTVWLTIASTVI